MRIVRVEDYAPNLRTCMSFQKGIEQGRSGRPKRVYGYEEVYKTNVGDLKKEDWISKTREIVEVAGETQLLEDIKVHCRENCAWLHKEPDIEEHALECLVRRSYKHWEGFQFNESPRVMIFIFDEKEVNSDGTTVRNV